MTEVPALVAEATKKTDVIWLAAGDAPATAAWHVWHEDAVYVVTGAGEQPLPGVAGATTCAVIVRSAETWTRIVTWEATVSRVEPGGSEWAAVVPTLVAKRLNLRDGDTAAERWAADGAVFRLAPSGRLLEAGDSVPTDSGAAAPRPTPATTTVRIPYTLGRRRGGRVRRRR